MMADGVACCGARRVKNKPAVRCPSQSLAYQENACQNTWQYRDAWWEQEGRKTGEEEGRNRNGEDGEGTWSPGWPSVVPVLAACVSCFPRGFFHAGVCRRASAGGLCFLFPTWVFHAGACRRSLVLVDLPGVIQCL